MFNFQNFNIRIIIPTLKKNCLLITKQVDNFLHSTADNINIVLKSTCTIIQGYKVSFKDQQLNNS